MIPFFQVNAIILGPVTIQVWGFFVAIGMLAGILLSRVLAKKIFLSPEVILDFSIWALIGGVVGARLGHVFFYTPTYYFANPVEILFLWQGGMSSLGGFIGALVAIFIFSKKRGFTWAELLPYFDVLSLGLWLGWAIGRIGCFMIHDHIGRLTDSFLSVSFTGGARFDLGLLESILAFVVFVVFVSIWKKIIKKRWGLVFVYSFVIYAIARFFLDFLRATDLQQTDVRYFSLTPMQWGIVLFLLGLTVYKVYSRILKRKS